MKSAPLASDLIRQIRTRFSLSRGGITLSAQEVDQLVSNLRFVEEIARETEEDNALIERQIAGSKQPVVIDITAENVIRFRPRLRLVTATPPSGGDAA
jgi:hypothetical protein